MVIVFWTKLMFRGNLKRLVSYFFAESTEVLDHLFLQLAKNIDKNRARILYNPMRSPGITRTMF